MKKRVLSIFLAVAMLCGMVPAVFAEELPSLTLKWERYYTADEGEENTALQKTTLVASQSEKNKVTLTLTFEAGGMDGDYPIFVITPDISELEREDSPFVFDDLGSLTVTGKTADIPTEGAPADESYIVIADLPVANSTKYAFISQTYTETDDGVGNNQSYAEFEIGPDGLLVIPRATATTTVTSSVANTVAENSIQGTAAPGNTGTVTAVYVSVQNGSGQFLNQDSSGNPTTFDSNDEVWIKATGTTSWKIDARTPIGTTEGVYSIRAYATDDNSGRDDSKISSGTFTLDTTKPAITAPAAGSSNNVVVATGDGTLTLTISEELYTVGSTNAVTDNTEIADNTAVTLGDTVHYTVGGVSDAIKSAKYVAASGMEKPKLVLTIDKDKVNVGTEYTLIIKANALADLAGNKNDEYVVKFTPINGTPVPVEFGTASGAKTYGDAPFPVSATSSVSGASITYSTTDSNIEVTSDGQVTIKSVGDGTATITATATKSGDASPGVPYIDGTATYTLTIDRKDITAKLQALQFTKVYDNSEEVRALTEDRTYNETDSKLYLPTGVGTERLTITNLDADYVKADGSTATASPADAAKARINSITLADNGTAALVANYKIGAVNPTTGVSATPAGGLVAGTSTITRKEVTIKSINEILKYSQKVAASDLKVDDIIDGAGYVLDGSTPVNPLALSNLTIKATTGKNYIDSGSLNGDNLKPNVDLAFVDQGSADANQAAYESGQTVEFTVTGGNNYYTVKSAPTQKIKYTVTYKDSKTITVNVTGKTEYDGGTISVGKANVTIGGAQATNATYADYANTAYDGVSAPKVLQFTVYKKDASGNYNVFTGDIKNAGDYKVAVHYENETEIGNGEAEFSVGQKVLTINSSGIAATKEYDGDDTIDATHGELTGPVSLSGWVGGDGNTVTINATYTFDNKNASTGQTKTVSFEVKGFTITDTNVEENNYKLPDMRTGSRDNAGTITKKAVSFTLPEVTKVYDGTADLGSGTVTALAGAALTDLVSGDDAHVVKGTVAYSSADANNNINLTGAFALEGEDKDNYTLTPPTAPTGKITPARLTGTPEIAETNNGAEDGTVEETDVLTVNKGSMPVDPASHPGTNLTYAWENNSNSLGTDRTYTVGSGITGRIKVTVTATGNYEGTVTAEVRVGAKTLGGTVAIAKEGGGTPTDDDLAVGKKLEPDISGLTPAELQGTDKDQLDFVWLIDGNTVGTGEQYEIKPADLGKDITLRVRAKESSEAYTGSVTSAPVTIPAAKPVISNLTAIGGNGSLTVNANIYDGGSPLTDLTVTVKNNGVPVATRPVSSWPVTIDGLMNGTTYTVEVSATNSKGTTTASTTGTPTRPNTGGGGGGGIGGGATTPAKRYTVTYDPGRYGKFASNAKTTEQVTEGKAPSNIPAVTANAGYKLVGWTKDGKTLVDLTQEKITADVTYTAHYERDIGGNGADEIHILYMIGRGDDEFIPEGFTKRSETATILARLTPGFSENVSYIGLAFSDVRPDSWYYKYVNFAKDNGFTDGYEDGTFRPESPVTRAEFSAMVARHIGLLESQESSGFPDAKGHWAEGWIAALRERGIVNGYEDGTFLPDQNITRAEAAKIVNGALGRQPDPNLDLEALGLKNPFVDVREDAWYYANVMEATVEHHPTEIFHRHAETASRAIGESDWEMDPLFSRMYGRATEVAYYDLIHELDEEMSKKRGSIPE